MVCLVCLTGITLVWTLAYIARCLLIIVEATAAGADKPEWPDEGYLDWFTRSLPLLGLSLMVLTPAGIVAVVAGLPVSLTIGPLLWLLFPVGMLSSMSATTRWIFFRPLIVTRMMQLAPATIKFYLGSAFVVGLGLGFWYWTVSGERTGMLLVAAPFGAAMVLIYARMLGQLAWRIGQLGPATGTRSTKRKNEEWIRAEDDARVPSHIPRPAPRDLFGSDVKPAGHIPKSPTGLLEVENLVPYELADPKAPTPARHEAPAAPRVRSLDPEEEDAKIPFELQAPPPPNPAVTTDMFLSTLPRSWEAQRPLARNAPPGSSFVELICFPLLDTCRSAWLWLTLFSVIIGLLVGQLMIMAPR
jgi:hypothetical protein